MRLWLFETISGGCDYDEYDSFVIAARDESRAKALASEFLGDGFRQKITDFKVRQVFAVKEEEGVLISSFNAG